MAIVGSVSYNIRAKGFTEDNCRRLKFLKVGCGAGYNFVWLAEQSVRISDIPYEASLLCHKLLTHIGLGKNIDALTISVLRI